MTEKETLAVKRALALVGDGYIYGATGWVCSLARRQRQAAQYPAYADTILTAGAKWDGKICWDCAQLTRTVAKEGGIALPSGATSQWNGGPWKSKGSIDSLPPDKPAFLYRRKDGSATVMQHTGFALGDGMFVHARGTAYGVLRQALGEYAWTHWASPWEAQGKEQTMESYKATVIAERGSTVNLRDEPGGKVLGRVPLGTAVAVSAEAAGWAKVNCGGMAGWMQSAFLQKENALTLESLAAQVKAIREWIAAHDDGGVQG